MGTWAPRTVLPSRARTWRCSRAGTPSGAGRSASCASALDGMSGSRTRPWSLTGGFKPPPRTDARVRQDRVERRRELAGAITNEELKPGGAVAEAHDEVAGLLGGPGPVGISGHAEDVQVAVSDLEHEQHVQPPQRERAVDVEEVDREHAASLGAQELPPTGVGVP